MAAFADYSVARVRGLQDALRRRVQMATALQDAAQEFAGLLAEEFDPVLARVSGLSCASRLASRARPVTKRRSNSGSA